MSLGQSSYAPCTIFKPLMKPVMKSWRLPFQNSSNAECHTSIGRYYAKKVIGKKIKEKKTQMQQDNEQRCEPIKHHALHLHCRIPTSVHFKCRRPQALCSLEYLFDLRTSMTDRHHEDQCQNVMSSKTIVLEITNNQQCLFHTHNLYSEAQKPPYVFCVIWSLYSLPLWHRTCQLPRWHMSPAVIIV